jgi:ATP-dependent helicase HrpA
VPAPSFDPDHLKREIASCMLIDQRDARARLRRLLEVRSHDPHFHDRAGKLAAMVAASQRRRAARAANIPTPRYPEDLPVSAKKDEIAAAIRDHQVVILCGETGSGKTTQLPKICLELGRGVAGLIGHTQPRRIAARSVAARIAEELDSPLGAVVGYKVRFGDQAPGPTRTSR